MINKTSNLETLQSFNYMLVKATIWPGKHGPEKFRDSSPLLALKTEQGVMRVVNIVSSKCRVLASRERCPFLVHCEVLETGLDGSDARLYVNAEDDVGATIQEILGVASAKKDLNDQVYQQRNQNTFPSYQIPSEISSVHHSGNMNGVLEKVRIDDRKNNVAQTEIPSHNNPVMLRGGNQYGDSYNNMDSTGYQPWTPYDAIQEEQLQRLHEHLQLHQQHPHYGPRPPSIPYINDER